MNQKIANIKLILTSTIGKDYFIKLLLMEIMIIIFENDDFIINNKVYSSNFYIVIRMYSLFDYLIKNNKAYEVCYG